MRYMLIGGLLPMGCLPIQITARCKYFNGRKCLQDQNLDSQNYNKKVAKLLPKLQKSLPGSLLLYADTYKPLMDMIHNPQKYVRHSHIIF